MVALQAELGGKSGCQRQLLPVRHNLERPAQGPKGQATEARLLKALVCELQASTEQALQAARGKSALQASAGRWSRQVHEFAGHGRWETKRNLANYFSSQRRLVLLEFKA